MEIWKDIPLCVLWTIWQQRNGRDFGGVDRADNVIKQMFMHAACLEAIWSILIWSFAYKKLFWTLAASMMVYIKSLSFDFKNANMHNFKLFPLNLHAGCTPSYEFYFFCLIGFNFICFFNLCISYFCKCYFRFIMWLCQLI